MSEIANRSLVVVYSSPVVMDAQLVRSVLAADGLHATVTEPNDPFAGLASARCEVLVWAEDEARARTLIEQAAAHHRAHVGHAQKPHHH